LVFDKSHLTLSDVYRTWLCAVFIFLSETDKSKIFVSCGNNKIRRKIFQKTISRRKKRSWKTVSEDFHVVKRTVCACIWIVSNIDRIRHVECTGEIRWLVDEIADLSNTHKCRFEHTSVQWIFFGEFSLGDIKKKFSRT